MSILNRSDRIAFSLSPFFCVVVAFCFSMTIGVLWEFFEFGMDQAFGLDMQKDSVVIGISRHFLAPSGVAASRTHRPHRLGGGERTGAGSRRVPGHRPGDTMADLFVNFVRALAFSVIRYRYLKSRGEEGRFVRRFVYAGAARSATSKIL